MSHHGSKEPVSGFQLLIRRVIVAVCWMILFAIIGAIALVLLSAFPVCAHFEPALRMFFKTFDLTISDVRMILVFTVIFPLILLALQSTIFKPFLRLIEAREAATVGAAQTIQQLRQKHEELRQQVESKLAATRLSALQKKAERLKAAREEANQKILVAENTAKAAVLAEREKIEANFKELKESLSVQSSAIAECLVEKIKNVNG